MGNLINSIKGFIDSLTLTDVTLLVAIIILIILIVVLIYVQRDESILKEEEIDLSKVKDDLVANNKPKTINLSDYEAEQEEKAIISYEELLQNTGKINLSYEEENYNDGLAIKKVDTEHMTIELPKLNNKYQKEEEYLNKLKNFKNYND